jgi:hypothetical protein
MKKNTLLQILLCFTVISCGNSYKQEIKTIDSLANEINLCLKKYETLDLDNLHQVALKARNNTSRLKEIVPDTIDQELGRIMTIYKDYRKADIDFYRRFLQIKEEMLYCQLQLKNLSADLNNNIINKDSVRYYYELEKDASVQVIKMFESMSQTLPQYYQTFDSVNALLLKKIEYLDSIKKIK